MPKLYRISNYPSLQGRGEKTPAHRWNERGLDIIYTSENLALAYIETVSHIEKHELPLFYTSFEITYPKTIEIEKTDLNPNNETETQKFGSQWLREKRSVLLKVKSARLPKSYNFLINPKHPDITQFRIKAIEEAEHNAWLRRLFD